MTARVEGPRPQRSAVRSSLRAPPSIHSGRAAANDLQVRQTTPGACMSSEVSEREPLGTNLWSTLSHVSEWVRFADTKAAGVLTLDGILATVLVSAFATGDKSQRFVVSIVLVVAAAFLVVSGVMCMACLLPRLTIGHANNVVYFAGISRYSSPDEYVGELRRLVECGEFETELARETWSRSQAAAVKYKYVRWSLFALSGALLASAILGVLAVVLD
jgi:hypothetical protein